ncbi:DUF4271 domain-containing protein [Neolewinella lacunae]|uniref:DUF4271 domain-containing protein n=1 Tax=Neolewinella lacunae TaxID=1517758 RepID=A0A923PP74_9BACT|nr:DUF4271 domain-containing protein [Neolewinella lacunae]MBC6996336.1 DUF4271 domain-containing protein [Neolewinella lacunae]MDN3636959.1 DUF4271 domain-containing protein [Neolewinella lacunae]
MRYLVAVLFLALSLGDAAAQAAPNPFEIRARLPQTDLPANDSVRPATAYGPFDIRPAGSGLAPTTSRAPATARPAGFGPVVIQSTDPNQGKGSILIIQLLLLVTLASLWVLFGNLLRQCFRGTINDSLMNQIYTRRSGGELTALWLCYLFFFFAAGFFVYLFALRHNVSLNLGPWGSWLTYTLAVAGAVGLKHWVLWAYARVFPVRKEVSRYAFVLMVFSILAGLFLTPTSLAASYAPPEWRDVFLYGGLLVLVVIYGFHLLRGLAIASRLAFARPVHILLYLCAIEIAPVLLLYRYFSDALV